MLMPPPTPVCVCVCCRRGRLHIRDAAADSRLPGLPRHQRHVAAVSVHLQPSSGVVPVPAQVLPQPRRHGQELQLQMRHKELQQGLPLYLLRAPETAVSVGRGNLAFQDGRHLSSNPSVPSKHGDTDRSLCDGREAISGGGGEVVPAETQMKLLGKRETTHRSLPGPCHFCAFFPPTGRSNWRSCPMPTTITFQTSCSVLRRHVSAPLNTSR